MPINYVWKSFLFHTLHFLKVPELDLPAQATEEFERIYSHYISSGNGDFIPYTSNYPKYLFLHYLIENKDVLVHGSNNENIEIFEPREQLLFTGNPVKAVFAASDGIWSMFFAVINRREYVGSLRNACFTLQTKKGIKRFYYFSVNEEYKGKLWRDGCIYIMPKNFFKRGGIQDEWICENKVKPLAKLSVTPKDFPFLEKVKRHKETDSMFKTIVKALIFNR
ncbi:hypothetical protein EDD69_10642 [Thermolongibacillus altinsuensis]|jgi:hypothetical protein|uniref:Uncharacterized protein n=1 Tax=Thermolongibacillus altinsuensis TaxID=575256 RepID=A0A4R1QF35_9BACL|nr:hypothetical protein [Thermolongibacillus altinsuensis]TCL49691.1 hypothetical protein EDD69_10642 [Thermolongibacillus altinsuensis]GMB09602.1 hypothetical protein B1no1_23120 [Thermolongibacillus altinsuensis]